MAKEKLFPDDGLVSVDKIFKEVLDKKRYKWKPHKYVKKGCQIIGKSIVNPKK